MSRIEKENEITNYWKKHKMFERSVEERPKDNQYVFYDGPPFATGTPHHGHILGLTSKDVFPRYYTMKGKRVERKWGWDCHGLPIENVVEKDLGIKGKHQIEEMGIDKFNEKAREKVLYFADEWKKTVDILGKWIDFDDSYKTMDQTYMETIWNIFKKFYDQNYIYKGKKILMYCPRCQTPLANSEIQMDNSYKDVTEKTATVAFKLKEKDEYVLAWTTTPWTLIGNVALAVNSELDYVLVNVFDKKYILAKDLVEKVFEHFEIEKEFKGKELIGLNYDPLYEVETNGKKGYYIIDGGKEVTSEDGTGIVHMAAYGEFDYEMIKKHDLPLVQHVGKDGMLIDGPKNMKGLWFKKADGGVLEDLYNRGLLVSSKDYTHSYPFCYRCETPLIYNPVDSWFIDIQKLKPKLKEHAKEINWYPENVVNRFNHIIDTAPDWNISRNRYWATAIPIWECECGERKVIGSIKELIKEATTKVSEDVDLHKHVVDKIKLTCNCSKEMQRIPEVMDCWFESGSMPFASKHYPFENVDWMKENYPADFISEYIAQVRAWFYYMHVVGTFLQGKAPFQNVVVSGTILAKDGTKMSKSKNNYTPPQKLFEEYGADSLRFYLMSSQLMRAQDLNFIDDNVREIHRKLLMILSNVKRFYELFGKENKEFNNDSSENILDKWLVSNTHKLVKDATKNLDDYDTTELCSQVLVFVDELSTWFVRRSRDRFKAEGKEKENAIKTLAFALDNLSKVLAPITPFISEEIYQSLRGTNFKSDNSVHLEYWPTFNEEKINEKLNEKMNLVREVVSKGQDARVQVKIPVKQPLAKLTISRTVESELFDLIKDELNVKEIEIKENNEEELFVELDTNLTPELKEEGAAREIIRKINDMRKKSGLTIDDRINVLVETDADLIKNSVDSFKEYIKNNVQADSLEINTAKGNAKEFTIKDCELKISI